MEITLSFIIIFGIYLIGLIYIVHRSVKSGNAYDYIIASKKLRWYDIGSSLFASSFSAYTIIIVLGLTFVIGPYVLYSYAAVLVGFSFIYMMLSRYYGTQEFESHFTIIDFFRKRLGPKTAKLTNFVFTILLFFLIVLILQINSFFISTILETNFYLTAVIILGIVLFYSYFGGFKSVIRTDLFQTIVMFVIIVFLLVVAGSPLLEAKHTINELFPVKTFLLLGVALFFVQLLTTSIQPDYYQRYMGAKDRRELKLGVLFGAVLAVLFAIPLVMLGLMIATSGSFTDPNTAFFELLNTSLFTNPILTSILVVSLFAAFMSSLDSYLFAVAAQTGTSKIFGKKEISMDKRSIEKRIKSTLVILAILAFLFLVFFQTKYGSNFMQAAFDIVSAAIIFSVVLFFSYFAKISQKEAIAGIVVGLVSFIALYFLGYLTQSFITALYPVYITLGYLIIQRLAVSIFERLNNY